MHKDNVIYKAEKLENPTGLRIREQLDILGNSHYVTKNNGRYLCYSANCKKTNSKFIYAAVCTHKKTGKKAKTLRNIMKHYIVRKVTKILVKGTVELSI